MKEIVIVLIVVLMLHILSVSVGGDKSSCTREVVREGLYSEDPQEVEKVLEKCILTDVDINPVCKGKALCKPIIMAALNGSLEVVKLLINAGASVNVNGSGNSGDTPLIISLMKGEREMVKYLVKHGADVNQKNNLGVSPFWGVCSIQDLEFVELFLDHGGDVNTKGTSPDPLKQQKAVVENVTPLMLAALYNNEKMLRLLLKNRAVKDHKDSKGRYAADYTTDKELRKLLVL